MGWELAAILAAGLFAGASVYINLVEHPDGIRPKLSSCNGHAGAACHHRPAGWVGRLDKRKRGVVVDRRRAPRLGYSVYLVGDLPNQPAALGSYTGPEVAARQQPPGKVGAAPLGTQRAGLWSFRALCLPGRVAHGSGIGGRHGT